MTYEEIVCDANNLYKAYKASIKGSKWKETTQKFMINFLRYLIAIQDDLLNRTLQNGPAEEFSLSERGRVRPITSICIRDRIVRHVLCDEIFLPEVRKHIIYDNGASIKGRGISHQRDRFEVHLRRYYKMYGNEGWILFGDFSKFYDNIIHEIAKRELLKLFDDDEFIDWLLTLIFDGFKIDVSYMSDEEYASCMEDTFNKLDYRNVPKNLLTGEKWMYKSVNIGDQLSQIIGIYYPYRIDNYVKYVRQQKFYGRYMDDFFLIHEDKAYLQYCKKEIEKYVAGLGLSLNNKTNIFPLRNGIDFLGFHTYITDTGKVIRKVRRSSKSNEQKKLKKQRYLLDSGKITLKQVEQSYGSWRSHAEKGNCYHLIREMDELL